MPSSPKHTIQRLHVEASARERFDVVRRRDGAANRDLVNRIITHGQGGGRQFVTACHELILLLFRVLAVLLGSHWLGTLLRRIDTEARPSVHITAKMPEANAGLVGTPIGLHFCGPRQKKGGRHGRRQTL